MTVLKTQALLGELINIRGCTFNLGTINPYRVAVYIVQGNEHDIQFWVGKITQAYTRQSDKEKK